MEKFLKDLLCNTDYKTGKMWQELADYVTKDKFLIIDTAERELSNLDYNVLSDIYDDERYAVILNCMDNLELSIEEIVGVVSPEIIRAIGHEYIKYINELDEIITIIGVSLSHSIWNFYITQECACDFIKGPEFLGELEGELMMEYLRLSLNIEDLMNKIDFANSGNEEIGGENIMKESLRSLICSTDLKIEKMWKDLAKVALNEDFIVNKDSINKLSCLSYVSAYDVYYSGMVLILDCMEELENTITRLMSDVEPKLMRSIGHEYIRYISKSKGNVNDIGVALSHSIWNFHMTKKFTCEFVAGPEYTDEIEDTDKFKFTKLDIDNLMGNIDCQILKNGEFIGLAKKCNNIDKNELSKPVITLFMLMSIDGKISTGAGDNLDFDSDFVRISGVKEGLYQYYGIQEITDVWSMTSGKIMAKLGYNTKPYIEKIPVSFVIIDNKHLFNSGVENLCSMLDRVVIITNNKNHPAMEVNRNNLDVLHYDILDLNKVLKDLKEKFSCERLTVQTDGTINNLFLRSGLLDYLNIVIAPVMVGGKDTPTLMDGESIRSVSDLNKLGVLQLESVKELDNSYVNIMYKVIETKVDNKDNWSETRLF